MAVDWCNTLGADGLGACNQDSRYLRSNMDRSSTSLSHSAAHWAASDGSVNDLTGNNLDSGSSRRAGGGNLGWSSGSGDLGWRGSW